MSLREQAVPPDSISHIALRGWADYDTWFAEFSIVTRNIAQAHNLEDFFVGVSHVNVEIDLYKPGIPDNLVTEVIEAFQVSATTLS